MSEKISDLEPAAEADAMTQEPYSEFAVQMLRAVQTNTMRLSQMADQKASILMGATFLVFSIAVSRSLVGDLPWSLVMLAIFAFLSNVFAVFAVLPSVGVAKKGARSNLMFFGHFSELDEDEWMGDVLDNLHTDREVYQIMLHDIYQNGQVLQRRKYRFLGYAYKVFIVGLVMTLAAFMIEISLTT